MSKVENDGTGSQTDNYEDASFVDEQKSGQRQQEALPSLTQDSFKPGTPVDTSNLFMFDFGNLQKVIQDFQAKISVMEKKLVYIEQNSPNLDLTPRNVNKVDKTKKEPGVEFYP